MKKQYLTLTMPYRGRCSPAEKSRSLPGPFQKKAEKLSVVGLSLPNFSPSWQPAMQMCPLRTILIIISFWYLQREFYGDPMTPNVKGWPLGNVVFGGFKNNLTGFFFSGTQEDMWSCHGSLCFLSDRWYPGSFWIQVWSNQKGDWRFDSSFFL